MKLHLKRLGILSLVIVVSSFFNQAPGADPNADDKKSIQNLFAIYQDAYNSGDAEGAANIYTEEAKSHVGADTVIKGRTAIQQTLQRAIDGTARQNLKMNIKTDSIAFASPNVALVDGFYEVSSGGKTIGDPTRFSSVFIKDNRNWLCAFTFEWIAPVSQEPNAVPGLSALHWLLLMNAVMLATILLVILLKRRPNRIEKLRETFG